MHFYQVTSSDICIVFAGLESFPEMILNIYKKAANFNDLTATVAKLKEDAFKDTKIPESKKADVMKTISAQLAPLATKMVNGGYLVSQSIPNTH